jgi:hypothetical protein
LITLNKDVLKLSRAEFDQYTHSARDIGLELASSVGLPTVAYLYPIALELNPYTASKLILLFDFLP